MSDFIERIRAIQEPNRDLDIEIAQAVYPGLEQRAIAFGTDQGKWFLNGTHVRIEHYTGSLDAAMSLAPKGLYCRTEPRFFIDGERIEWWAYCIKPIWDHWTPYDDWFLNYEAKAKTPESAMILAALRARNVEADALHPNGNGQS